MGAFITICVFVLVIFKTRELKLEKELLEQFKELIKNLTD